MLSRVAALSILTLAACGSTPPPAAPAAPTPAPASSADPSASPASADAASAPASPEVIVLAHGLGAVGDVVASGPYIYLARKTSLVTRIPISGAGAMTDVATFEKQATIDAIAAGDEGVYVLITAIGDEATKGGYAGQGSLFLVPAKGGSAQSLAQGFRHATSMVIDDTTVRWAALKDSGSKSSWALFSAPRTTGTPVTSTLLGESAADAKIASDKKTARLVGEANGSALVSWDSGALVVHPFDRTVKNPAPLAIGDYAFTAPRVALHGGLAVIGGTARHGGKNAAVVGTFSLAGSPELTPFATLDAASAIGGVAFVGDDVVYSVAPSKDIADKHGSIVRVAASDKKSTVLATDQFQPADILPTSRGLVWIDKGANESGDPDGTLVLLPQ